MFLNTFKEVSLHLREKCQFEDVLRRSEGYNRSSFERNPNFTGSQDGYKTICVKTKSMGRFIYDEMVTPFPTMLQVLEMLAAE